MAEILEVVRASLRRKTTALDETELMPLISASEADLRAGGVEIVDNTDPLTQSAIRLFVKGMVEGDEKTLAIYEQMKNGLAVNSEYKRG